MPNVNSDAAAESACPFLSAVFMVCINSANCSSDAPLVLRSKYCFCVAKNFLFCLFPKYLLAPPAAIKTGNNAAPVKAYSAPDDAWVESKSLCLSSPSALPTFVSSNSPTKTCEPVVLPDSVARVAAYAAIPAPPKSAVANIPVENTACSTPESMLRYLPWKEPSL